MSNELTEEQNNALRNYYQVVDSLTKEILGTTNKKCPRCGKSYTGFPALSRVDNKTDICSPCGTEEAMQDYAGEPLSPLDEVTEPMMPVSTVVHILETVNTYLVVHEDQEAWQYVQVVLKAIKDGEI